MLSSEDQAIALRGPTVIYDEYCGLCESTIEFLARRCQRLRIMRGHETATQKFVTEGLGIRDFDKSWVVLLSNQVHRKTDGLSILLGECESTVWRIIGGFIWWTPRFLRDGVYEVVAKLRYFISGSSCPRPKPETQALLSTRLIQET